MRAAVLRAIALSLLLCLFPVPHARAQEQQPANPSTGAIHVSVDRVNVGVIVTDSHGAFVAGLRPEDFHIFDDGVEQPITDFAPIDEPAQVLMLVEAGPSVYFLEAGHERATHAMLAGLSAGDRVAVAKYDAAPQLLLDFTPNKPAAEAALTNVRYYIGFGSLNLSQSLSTVLDWLAKVQGKKTIVLLSTGFDTSPTDDLSPFLARLSTSDVRILAVSLSAELRTSNSAPKQKRKNQPPPDKAAITEQGFAEADRFLSLLTDATGGRVYFPNGAKDFTAVYAEIAQLVRHEYSLAFAPPVSDAKVHTIEVRVSPPPDSASSPAPSAAAGAAASSPASAYRVDHRRSYVAPNF
jgi:Ca-activated chloride channel family protein